MHVENINSAVTLTNKTHTLIKSRRIHDYIRHTNSFSTDDVIFLRKRLTVSRYMMVHGCGRIGEGSTMLSQIMTGGDAKLVEDESFI